MAFGDGARGGLWQGDPGLIHDGAVAIGGDGRVLAVGPTARVRDVVDLSPKARVYNASGCAIVPGFFDACAEAIVADAGDDPTASTSAGAASRVQPAADPMAAALALSERDLVARALAAPRRGLLLRGTDRPRRSPAATSWTRTTRLALLRAVQAITDVGPCPSSAAFRAAGITPGENRISADEYVSLLTQELLPDIADDELAYAVHAGGRSHGALAGAELAGAAGGADARPAGAASS